MINFNPPANISDRVNAHIDQALELEQRLQSTRSYLGGSMVGVECDRALQYEFTKTPVDPDKGYSGRILRIFDRGHWVETAMAGWLRSAGFGLVTGTKDGGQFGFSTLGGVVKGHCDGVFVAGPVEFGPWPRLWECKGLEQKYYLQIVRHGLRVKKPIYWAQAQYYMKHFKLTENPCLFSVVNMNRMEIYWEDIVFDPVFADGLDAKAARIIAACNAGELLPRASQKKDFYGCKMCNWNERCFSGR